MKCKFCGCTERKPCQILIVDPPRMPQDITACAWLIPGICSAPACVEKAYLEARELALPLMESLALQQDLLIA